MSANPELIESLRSARHVVFLTGAGVSAESGVATFRDKQTGLWQRFDAMELATPTAFARDPALVWGWYEWRRMLVRRAHPNPAHCAIAALAWQIPKFTLITQNVDDLHERAGSQQVLHLHGTLATSFCEACKETHQDCAPANLPEGGRRSEPPRCRACGARVRPGVVWFGEALPQAPWQAALAAAQDCDVFFCVGTSSLVQPAASLTQLATDAGALTVINPNATDIDASVDVVLRGPAGVLLPDLLRQAGW